MYKVDGLTFESLKKRNAYLSLIKLVEDKDDSRLTDLNNNSRLINKDNTMEELNFNSERNCNFYDDEVYFEY